MARPVFMLDSNILISHLNKELDLDGFFAALPEYDAYITRIVEIETLAKPGMSDAEEAEAKTLLSTFIRADFTDTMRDETVRIRRSKKLLLPDAVIAAAAIELNATVLSKEW